MELVNSEGVEWSPGVAEADSAEVVEWGQGVEEHNIDLRMELQNAQVQIAELQAHIKQMCGIEMGPISFASPSPVAPQISRKAPNPPTKWKKDTTSAGGGGTGGGIAAFETGAGFDPSGGGSPPRERALEPGQAPALSFSSHSSSSNTVNRSTMVSAARVMRNTAGGEKNVDIFKEEANMAANLAAAASAPTENQGKTLCV